MTDSNLPLPALIGVASLMRRAFAGENLMAEGASLLARAHANPDDAHALMDLSTVLQLTGNRADALAVQAEAIAMQQLYAIPGRRAVGNFRLLAIMGPGDLMSNTPIEFLVAGSDVTLDLLYMTTLADWPQQVPDHDLLLVAVAESEASQPLLQRLEHDLQHWPRPIVNRPAQIAVLSRDGACAALQNIAAVEMPLTVRLPRDRLQAIADGHDRVPTVLADGDFPVIVRPTGSHAGQQLDKLSDPAGMATYLANVEASQFYLSRFVDYRSADGQFRKYRIVLIDGAPFVCHFAISSHWMIHYLNAGMTESADKRAEEADCMAHFDQQFAHRHARALQEINQRIGLPYLGIDCAETPSGELLIFEIDNAMIVHDMDPDNLFPYKKPVMKKLFTAFRDMLERHRHHAPPA